MKSIDVKNAKNMEIVENAENYSENRARPDHDEEQRKPNCKNDKERDTRSIYTCEIVDAMEDSKKIIMAQNIIDI